MEALDYLKSFEELEPSNKILSVLKVNVLWNLEMKKEALELFKICLIENKEKAIELFEINPALKNVSELVLLADN